MQENNNNATDQYTLHSVMRPLFIANIEKLLLESKRFRKCDWQNIDGIDYIKMMDTHTLALVIRDIVKELGNEV
jgi:hypothetical protein